MQFSISTPQLYSKSRNRRNQRQSKSQKSRGPNVSMANFARLKNQEVENALREATEIRKLAEIKLKSERQKKAEERLRRQTEQWTENRRQNVVKFDNEPIRRDLRIENPDSSSDFSTNYAYDDSYYYIDFRKKTKEMVHHSKPMRHSIHFDLNDKPSKTKPRPRPHSVIQDSSESVSF